MTFERKITANFIFQKMCRFANEFSLETFSSLFLCLFVVERTKINVGGHKLLILFKFRSLALLNKGKITQAIPARSLLDIFMTKARRYFHKFSYENKAQMLG